MVEHPLDKPGVATALTMFSAWAGGVVVTQAVPQIFWIGIAICFGAAGFTIWRYGRSIVHSLGPSRDAAHDTAIPIWEAALVMTLLIVEIVGSVYLALPTAMAASVGFLREYVLNGYVGSLLAGGLISAFVVGFWKNIGAFVNGLRTGPPRPLLLLSAVLLLATALSFALAWFQVRNDPDTFIPAISATFNADKSQRIFSDKEPVALEKIARANTEISEPSALGDEIGKWMAITGTIYDASPADSGTLVSLGGMESSATLLFSQSWLARLRALHASDRIYAVCKIVSVSTHSIRLDQCELVASGDLNGCKLCGLRWD